MESEEAAKPDLWDDFQWDPASEAELQAIEASYISSKRGLSVSHSLSDSDSSKETKFRRLPNWSLQSDRVSSRTSSSRDAIWDAAPAPCRANQRTKCQALKFGGQIHYCRTADEVERASMELLDKTKAKNMNGICQVSLGFDIEWRPSFRRGSFACNTIDIIFSKHYWLHHY